MGSVTLKLFASFRQPGLPDKFAVDLAPGSTVRQAVEALLTLRPRLREQVLGPGGQKLAPHVNIMLKGRLIRDLQGLDTPVANGDVLALFPPVAGG